MANREIMALALIRYDWVIKMISSPFEAWLNSMQRQKSFTSLDNMTITNDHNSLLIHWEAIGQCSCYSMEASAAWKKHMRNDAMKFLLSWYTRLRWFQNECIGNILKADQRSHVEEILNMLDMLSVIQKIALNVIKCI